MNVAAIFALSGAAQDDVNLNMLQDLTYILIDSPSR
jgi:hypothetical protein